MKKNTWLVLAVALFLFGSVSGTYGQEPERAKKTSLKVEKKTVMELYEPGMVLTVEDRIRLKKERLALIQKRRRIIDTLDISDRRKRRLLKELYSTPHSDRWERVIADIEFENDSEY